MKTIHLRVCFVAAAVLVLLACGESDRGAQPPSPDDAVTDWDASLADQARLVTRLPENTQAYLRVPSAWNLLSSPKPNAMAPALASSANREALAAMQQATRARLERDLGPWGGPAALLLEGLRSPLELAVLGEDDQPMGANVVIAGRLALDSAEALNDELAGVAEQFSMARLAARADADSVGHFLVGPVSLFYTFDPETSAFLGLAGMQVTGAKLREVEAWSAAEPSGLHQMERELDAGRQGLYLWSNGPWLQMALEQSLPAHERDTARTWGLMGIEQVALGYGVAEGRGQLGLIARGREGQFWDLALPAQPAGQFSVTGEPRWALGWRVPNYDWWMKLASMLSDEAEVDTQMSELDAELEQATGLRLEHLATVLPGRFFLVEDDNGAYLVQEDSDHQAFLEMMQTLAERFDLVHRQRDIEGRVIHHLKVPGMSPEGGDGLAALASEGGDVVEYLVSLVLQMGTHLYWMEDQGDLIIAQVPQVLLDRIAYPGDQAVADWFDETSRDNDRALLVAGLRSEGSTRRNYYSYLQTLRGMADILDFPLDLTDFPTARELALAETGRLSARLEFADNSVGLRLGFDHHPGDFVSGQGGLASVAVVGILAAVAIPAYQDYTVRAKIGAHLTEAIALRVLIQEHLQTYGELPSADQLESMGAAPANDPGLYYDAQQQGIVISLDDVDELDAGAQLLLLPELIDGQIIHWNCRGVGVAENWLPSQCRQ